MDSTVALIIFVITYLGIIFTGIPKLNIDRPSAAFFGAVAMVLFGVITFEDATRAVDFNTIALLLGMMIIIATLQLDGFFSLIAEKAISFSKTPTMLLVIVVFTTGIASAFLVNDAVVLLFTPVIITICMASGLRPIPFLIAEILSSNAGSVMSMTGNPQNMLIGIKSGITYGSFLLHLLPIAVISMIIIVFVVKAFYHDDFKKEILVTNTGTHFEYQMNSMKFSVPIFIGVIVLFFFGKLIHMSIPMIALTGASLILLFGRIKPSRIIKNVDWMLLLFFASLFIVVEAAEKAGVFNDILVYAKSPKGFSGIFLLHGISLVMSQLVSNVPFTVMMLPVLKPLSNDVLWLSLASASTLAGNATIIGAMANLIVIEAASGFNIRIRFWEFFKIGIVTTLLTFVVSVLILWAYSCF